jgi:hypothetical protein
MKHVFNFAVGNGPCHKMDQVKPRSLSGGTIKNSNMAKTIKIGRDARTGRFISIEEANRRPSTTVIEKVKVGPIKHRK